jgi:hypothetical protein
MGKYNEICLEMENKRIQARLYREDEKKSQLSPPKQSRYGVNVIGKAFDREILEDEKP